MTKDKKNRYFPESNDSVHHSLIVGPIREGKSALTAFFKAWCNENNREGSQEDFKDFMRQGNNIVSQCDTSIIMVDESRLGLNDLFNTSPKLRRIRT